MWNNNMKNQRIFEIRFIAMDHLDTGWKWTKAKAHYKLLYYFRIARNFLLSKNIHVSSSFYENIQMRKFWTNDTLKPSFSSSGTSFQVFVNYLFTLEVITNLKEIHRGV